MGLVITSPFDGSIPFQRFQGDNDNTVSLVEGVKVVMEDNTDMFPNSLVRDSINFSLSPYKSYGEELLSVDKSIFEELNADEEILRLEIIRGKWELLLRKIEMPKHGNNNLSFRRKYDRFYFEALFRTYYQACKDGKLVDYILFRKNFLKKVFSNKKAKEALIIEIKVMQQALRLFKENPDVQFGLEDLLLDS